MLAKPSTAFISPAAGNKMIREVSSIALATILATALSGCATIAESTETRGSAQEEAGLNDEQLLDASDIPSSFEDKMLVEDEALSQQLASIANSHAGSYAIACQATNGSWSARVNSTDAYVSASMIKLAVMGAFYNAAANGNVNLEDTVILQASDIVGGTSYISLQGAGSTWTYRELLQHMIQDSDNTATNILIDRLGMDTINDWASGFGLENTHLNRRMMDLGSGVENYMSANDVAKILQAICDGSFVNEDASMEALTVLEGQNETTGMELGLPNDVIFAHKTGSLNGVLNDGGIVETEKPYTIVVLSANADSGEAAAAMQEIALAISAYASAR